MRILSIDFYIPYLLKDENYPIGGWAIELTTWLRALDNAGHEAAVLTWKGALTHVGSNPPITLIETYDPKRYGLRGGSIHLFPNYWRPPAPIVRISSSRGHAGWAPPSWLSSQTNWGFRSFTAL